MSMGNDFLGVFYDEGGATNFGSMLFRLIAKADMVNMLRLTISFPREVGLYEWWYRQPRIPSRQELLEKATDLEKEPRWKTPVRP